MGLDLGKKRIGVSISTHSLDGALPLRTISEDKLSNVIDILKSMISEYNIIGIIFGLPKNMDGTEGKSAQSVRDKAELMCSKINIKYAFWDERLSTVAVERNYEKNEKSRSKKKQAKKELIKKLKIIINGAFKRNKLSIVNEFSTKLEYWDKVNF